MTRTPIRLEDPGDQDTADAAVAVGEGMDRLELGVSDGRLGYGVQVVSAHEDEEILHQGVDGTWGNGNMNSRQWTGSANPTEAVPPCPNVYGIDGWSVAHEALVPGEQPVCIDRSLFGKRIGHHGQVVRHP